MPPPKKGAKKKQRKLQPPEELLRTMDNTIDDSDILEGDVNEKEYAFITDVSDTDGEVATEKAKSSASTDSTNNKATKSAKQVKSANADASSKGVNATDTTMSTVQIDTTRPSSSTHAAKNSKETTVETDVNAAKTSTATELRSEDGGAIGGDVRTHSSTTTRKVQHASTNAEPNASLGAIPKTKAAYKQGSYELPRQSENWFDEVQRSERGQERNTDSVYGSSCNVRQGGNSRHVAFDPTIDNGHNRVTQHEAASQMPSQQRKTIPSIYDQPPRLVVDANVRSLYGDSAYFQGGEYRKPDTRTIYVEGMERMYQNTLQSTFDLLPKETIEYHIKAAEKYWDKFLDAHNLLYNKCETIDEIERHRVFHRNTQRLNENLMLRLLQQLSNINAEREQNNSAHSSSRNNRDVDNRDLRNIMNEVKFEKIRIASFDGQYQKWPQFKRIFETYFHNTNASNSAKMVHLLNHLEGEPQNLISGLDPRGENYDIAWRTICDAYDDERKILDAMITKFLDIPRVQIPTRASLMHLVTSTKNLIEPMQTYNVNTESWGVWIVPIIVRKLDAASHSEWCMERPRRVKPEIEPLLRFISNRAEGVEELPQTQNAARNGNNANNTRFQNQRTNSNSNSSGAKSSASGGGWPKQAGKKTRCPDPLCAPNNEHQMFNCPRFKSLDVEHRRQKVRALGICDLCLRKGHYSSNCTMKPCHECDERHNSWLCTRKIKVASTVAPPAAPLTAHIASLSTEDSHGDDEATLSTSSTVAHAPLLATAIITVTDRNGQKHQLRALCDQGSHADMITTAAYQVVGHGKTRTRLTVRGIGGKEATSVGQANISFVSRFDSGNSFRITALVLPTITGRLPSAYLGTKEWKHLDGLPLADPNFNVPDDIDVVLGASTCAALIKSGLVKGAPNQPIAQDTHIGWVIYGSTQASTRYLQTLHAVAEITEEARIDHFLTRFWEVESVPHVRHRSDEEQLCENLFVANTTRDETGRYVVRIPFKTNAAKLGDSRSIAVRRLLQMEARFAKKPELKSSYVEFMAEYLQLGHMVEAPPVQQGTQHNYIPHHAAGTKKFRVVFDGSCKTANGVAFNDVQLIGERLQPDLTSITMRFRTHKVALTADIKKMYRQVLVCPTQRDFQRIVWREEPKQPIKDYQLVTQTYGLRSAPHSCVRALLQCANDNEIDHPLAAEITRRDFYIDDLLSGADSDDSAATLHNEMNSMLAKGGFELAKWATNSEHLRSRLQGNEQLVTIDKDAADSSVLGLRWNPADDVFKYKISTTNQNEKITKRRVVSNIAKLYDPNGYVSPVIITAKILIQKLWQSECTWDGKVPCSLAKEYRNFMCELTQLEQLTIPRWIGTSLQSTRELHAFCDASNVAYGCAFYIKSASAVNDTTVKLVASKTRVAPIKRMTIPRLELCGAHLLAKMLHEVCTVHDVSPKNCHLWTDSMIVLYWLHKSPGTAKMYVANRIAETSELTRSCTWRHVPTKDNPADMASRGITASAIIDAKLWWEGPVWMSQSIDKWPKNELQLSEEHKASIASESSPPVVLLAHRPQPFLENENGDLLPQASSAHRLIRITAWVIRFANNAKKNAIRSSGPLTAEEYLTAESHWIRHEQRQHLTEEMDCPVEGGKMFIPKKSKLFGLNPFIQDGILRGKGRLEKSNLPYDSINPIILSAESRLTYLIVRSAHIATMHGGTQLTMHYVRQKYWVPAMRRLTRSIIHQCVQCVRQNATAMQQQMAALPKVRLTPGRAFQKCGVDYCGPFYVKARGGRCKIISKAYVAVFVCMASRAVHLELVSDLTSDAFLAALSRLSSRRGRVHELYSDNGTTFHGADKDITKAVNSWKELSSNTMFQALYIKWTFIPPLAPHQGGLWEAAVKSAKHHLRRVIGDQQLTFEEFATVLTQVEACLNSRPITRGSDDASDNLALTPSHSWALEPVVTPLARDHTDVPKNRLQRWKLLQQFVQDFWRRWKDEYLDQLFLRTKWKGEHPNAAIDDVVLVRSENTPPTQWPMGRIANIYPGSDGLVRSVDVVYGGHTYRRPVTKLVLLPTTDLD